MLPISLQMPMYAMGLDDSGATFPFATTSPALQLHWSTSNNEVAKLVPLFHEVHALTRCERSAANVFGVVPLIYRWVLLASLQSSIVPPPDNDFSVRFLAQTSGHVTVRLRVTSQGGSEVRQIRDGRVLSDSLQLEVYESLRLLQPSLCAESLLVTPNTRAQLRTNR